MTKTATNYRNFTISHSMVSYSPSTDYSWVHKDYDGEGDDRHGYGSSVEECIEQIEEWYEENGE